MKMNKVLWGLLVIACGVMLVLLALGIDTAPYQWSRIIGSVLLLGIALSGLIKLRFFVVLVPVAAIVYLWRIELGVPELNLWLLFLAAIVLGTGLSLLFRRPKHITFSSHNEPEYLESNEVDGATISIRSSFGEQTKYIHAEQLKRVEIVSHFASIKAYFDQCQPSDEGLTIDVSGHFSGIVLSIPRNWQLENKVSSFAAEVNDRGSHIDAAGPKVLLKGNINFAEIKIIRVD